MFSGDRGINLRQEELLREKRNNGIPEFEQKMNYQLPQAVKTSLPKENLNRYQQRPPSQQPQRRKPFVLYVWGSKEPNSKRALNIVNSVNLDPVVSIVDVRQLDRSDIAPWLTGVPTLLSIADKSVYRGTKCLDEILDVGEAFKRKRQQQQQQKQFMQREEPQLQSNMMMPQPQMLRRGGEEPDISSLPSFKEPEKESEQEKDDLKKQVEAIMARREKMIGVEKKDEVEK